MQVVWIVLGVVMVLALMIVLISYLCFRMAFYSPDRPAIPSDAIDIPEGAAYEEFRESMEKWARDLRYQYNAAESVSSESVSQVIVALAELGIALDDSRFVKNGNTLLDALMQFQQEDGGFAHLMDGETDLLATEQAFYALVAANRVAQGESSLYRMK